MIALFLRKEPVVRRLPLLALGAGVLTVLMARPMFDVLYGTELVPHLAERHSDVLHLLLVVPALQACAVAVLLLPLRVRIHEHELALPVPRRDVLRARLLALGLATGVPVLTSSAVLLVLVPRPLVVAEVLQATVVALALAVGIAAAFHAVQPGRARPSGPALLAVSLASVGALALPAFVTSSWLMPAVVLAALACAWGAWRATGREPEERWGAQEQSAGAGPGEPGWRRFCSPLQWMVLRSTVLRWRLLPALVVLPLLLAAVGREQVVYLLWFSPWLAFLATTSGLATLRELDALPYPRPALLRWAAWPVLAVLLPAFGSWLVLPERVRSIDAHHPGVLLDRMGEETLHSEREFGWHLKVPAQLWRIALPSGPVEVRSPWGEVHRPTLHPLFWGSPLVAYNPYDVDGDSSLRFLAWQLSRALLPVYGIELDADGVLARWYPDLDPAQPIDDLRLLRRDEPQPWAGAPRLLEARLPRAGVLLLLALSLWGAGVWMALVLARPVPDGRIAWRNRRAHHLLVVLALVGAVLGVAALEMGDRAVLPVVAAALARVLLAPLGPWGPLLLSVVLFVLLDRAFARRVLGIDPPVTRSGWTRRELPAW